ncbi:MAG: GNAT family N-acetyltransferase, partial [Defluviitaleaceae bacterium]|nr:GNAT family N-acetyltransferase [Defluviitaleaceae bacterium]
MDQLKMARDNKPAEARELPEGFYFAGFGDGDWKSWCECCIDAQLGVAEVSRAEFERIMLSDGKVKPENIYFLRSPEGQAVGTVTYQYGDAPGEGYIHMVGIVKGFRGMGLSTPMIQYAVGKMLNGGVRVMYLTTDDWRLPAIKTYLNCGFEPVIREKDAEMAQRWKNIMDRLGKGFSIDPAAGYFQNAGVDVMAYDDFYPEGHQSGVSVIMHGSRVASNGDVRIDRTPGQWQPVPKQIGREIDEKANTITVSMTYPGIAEAGLDYKVTVKGEGESVVVTVDFDRPVPESMAGGLFFNFELFPGALLGKPWIMDDKQGIFPRQPNGPVAETGAERQDGWLGEPYAIGKRFTVRPDDPYRRLTIETKGAPLKVYDGRMEHNNGWFVVSCDIPAGAAKNAVQWVITPNAVKDWVYAPVVQASQVGYHPAQAKTVVVELDRRDDKRGQLAVYKLGESGFREISSVAGREWGRFLRYQYLQFDLSGIREEGLYKVQYGASESSVFRVARDVYDRGVWQPVLEYFLPVQMCHMRVNEKYRVWHGLCHMDDARMAPVNQRHFDGYAQGPSTLTKYGPGDEVPGLNIGGWHDAGDDDLQISSQSGEVYALTLTYETFGVVYYDSTT